MKNKMIGIILMMITLITIGCDSTNKPSALSTEVTEESNMSEIVDYKRAEVVQNKLDK